MPKILTIDFKYRSPEIKLTGLSFKKISDTNIERNIIRSDTGNYIIETNYGGQLNRKTAAIELNYLIDGLTEIYECIPFDKIKTLGHYEATGEQIMELILQKINHDKDSN